MIFIMEIKQPLFVQTLHLKLLYYIYLYIHLYTHTYIYLLFDLIIYFLVVPIKFIIYFLVVPIEFIIYYFKRMTRYEEKKQENSIPINHTYFCSESMKDRFPVSHLG